MKSQDFVANDWESLGTTGFNLNVDYRGLRVYMLPSVFLKLAAPTNFYPSSKYIADHLRSGGKIGSPFLSIDIPEFWEDGDYTKPAEVVGHEGRNRMYAVQEVYGDIPVEVHLFFPGFRRRDLTDGMIESFRKHLLSEKYGEMISGRLFDY
jgi:hypothetical protein